MKVLVTGGTGFLGTALVQTLKSSGHEVILTTRRQENIAEGIFNLGDISADTNWAHLLQGCDTVIHTAGRAHILNDDAQDALAEFRRVNHDATIKLAKDAASSGVKHFIFISSIVSTVIPLQELPLQKHRHLDRLLIMPFPSSKAEQSLLKNFGGTDMAITIVRPALICGENAPGNIQRLLKLVSKNLPLPFKNVKNKRALVSLDNVVSFINECVVNEKAKNQLFLLADAERPSTEEMIETFAAGMDIKAKIIYFPKSIMKLLLSAVGKGGIYDQLFGDLEVDASKSREHLHWTPPITLHETMKKTAKYYTEGNK